MSTRILAAALLLCLVGCGGSQTGVGPTVRPSGVSLALEGRRLLATGEADSAVVILTEALARDSSITGAREDLALARYHLAMQSDSARRGSLAAEAYGAYADLEERGITDMVVYDRLCELAQATGDTAGFLRSAARAAARYPYDRQFFNLGSAQLAAGRYDEVMESQKQAIERFPDSPYRSGFYRLLGQAYVRVDRYQTAQRVFSEGVEEAERALAIAPEEGADQSALRRIAQDRIAMLKSLQRLYTIYDEQDKLNEVERRLRSAGQLE